MIVVDNNSQILVYIVNFNTTKLTNDCIKSIIAKLKSVDYNIVVFDNSTTIPFVCDAENKHKVTVLDNTNGDIIDFESVLKDSVDFDIYKYYQHLDTSRHGTLKHSYTIDYILKTTPADKILLFDSDTILLKDVDFISDDIITAANVVECANGIVKRFTPFIQYFNVEMIRKNSLSYFDKNRIMFGNNSIMKYYFHYDTGAAFFENCAKL